MRKSESNPTSLDPSLYLSAAKFPLAKQFDRLNRADTEQQERLRSNNLLINSLPAPSGSKIIVMLPSFK